MENGELRKEMISKKEWKEKLLKRLRKFAVSVILLANKFPKTPAGFVIAKQLIKSGTSIGANVQEAQDASSLKDFIQKLSISLREAKETLYWLQLVSDSGLLNPDENKSHIEEGNEIAAILTSSIKSAKKNNS